jgi:hypothetical protein
MPSIDTAVRAPATLERNPLYVTFGSRTNPDLEIRIGLMHGPGWQAGPLAPTGMVVLGVTDIGDEKYVYPLARLVIDNEDLLADADKWVTYPACAGDDPDRALTSCSGGTGLTARCASRS